MHETDIQAAKAAVKPIFDHLNIKRVVFVDDEYNKEITEDVILELCAELNTDEEEISIPGFGTFTFGVEGVWQAQVKQEWKALDQSQRLEVYRSLATLVNREDLRYENNLTQMFSGYELIKLSPQDWLQNKDSYLKDASKKKTLFLFDQDLSMAGGTQDGGILNIKTVLTNKRTSNSIMCGLLSHTFSPEGELTEWERLSVDHSIDKDKFTLISKKRLTADPTGFARMVKLTAISNDCRKLKGYAAKAIASSQKAALTEINKINVYDFDHLIFQASYREGVWEPDTLFRVYHLFHRKLAREKVKNDKKLANIATNIRNISSISTESASQPFRSSWKIQRTELYEDSEYINRFHMPIELGDIFEKKTNSKKYILLAQPCDLMIRTSDGKRKHTVTEAILAEIVDKLPIDERTGESKEHDAHYELIYFDSLTGDTKFVNFKKTHSIKLSLLDLCVFNSTGDATYTIGTNCPDCAIPTLKKYNHEINTEVNGIIRRYQDLQTKQLKKEYLDLVIPKSSHTNLFKGEIDITNKTLSYNFRRIARLCPPHSSAMLSKYGTYMSRPAFEADLGK